MWHLYVRNGIAYVPKVLRTDAGFFIDSDPVAVIPLADRERLVDALVSAIRSGHDTAKTPARDQYGVPAVAKAAGVSDGSTFARTARLFQIRETPSGYEIPVMERKQTGAWMERRVGDGVEHVETGVAHAVRRLVAKAIDEPFK